MIRSIKALGLALLAIAAVGAFAAASAQAAAGEVHITTEKKAVITGSGANHTFQIGHESVGRLSCTSAKSEGTVEQAETSTQITAKHLTLTATYEGCQGFLGAALTWTMNGCKYTLRGTAELTAQTQIVGCTAGKTIEMAAPSFGCTITIGEQAELKHVTFTNNAEVGSEKHHLQDHVTVSGLAYTRDGAFCPQGEATYTGTTTIKAFQDFGTQQVQNKMAPHQTDGLGHQYTQHNCGTEVGILGT